MCSVMKCWTMSELSVSVFQVHSLQTTVLFDGNCVFASLFHHVRHLALCAWAAPEMCQ